MTKKKIIGVIGGMGPYTGLDLANKIFDQTKADQSQDHLSIALLSCPSETMDRTAFLLDSSKVNPALAIFDMIRKLEKMGVVTIGIPCNTAHAPEIFDIILEKLKESGSQSLIVHIVNEVGLFIQENHPHIRKVGVLCTRGASVIHLYPTALKQHNIDVVLMSETNQDVIHDLIYNSTDGIKIKLNPGNEKIKISLLNVIRHLKENGAEAIILGCTELPLIITEKTIENIPIIDPTLILARALIRTVEPDKLKPY